jgi:hypothetical protein
VISDAEQRTYAGKVLRDLSLTIDGRPLTLRSVSMQFPAIAEMKEGMGAIRLEFKAEASGGGFNRRLVFENRNESRIGAYLANCLVPQDPDIRITAQNRNYSQSRYQVDYVESGAASETPALLTGETAAVSIAALLLLARFAYLWRKAPQATRASTTLP